MRRKPGIIIISLLGILIIGFFAGYSAWNAANPEKSCASCHEINPSLEMWQISSHREISCLECHGTAMSNGFHSLKEKSKMLFTHMTGEVRNRDILISEEQIIETMHRCVNCHREEYKKWQTGGHSATYGDIFLNEKHNRMEQPYWDCFRCHGMHYEGNIHDLIEPVNNKGPWSIIDPGKDDDPVITCMGCHNIHSENSVRKIPGSKGDPTAIFYERKAAGQDRNPKAGFFIRADKIYLQADMLPEPEFYDAGKKVEGSYNPLQRICIQCHAPDFSHRAGSQDDHTPTGVHEGLSCMACHETHSNDASNSCMECHPAISNCGQDHLTMNTSYKDPESPNNIHHVKCSDCHEEGALYTGH